MFFTLSLSLSEWESIFESFSLILESINLLSFLSYPFPDSFSHFLIFVLDHHQQLSHLLEWFCESPQFLFPFQQSTFGSLRTESFQVCFWQLWIHCSFFHKKRSLSTSWSHDHYFTSTFLFRDLNSCLFIVVKGIPSPEGPGLKDDSGWKEIVPASSSSSY